MPAKNVLKIYFAGAYYHLYNRGVNKTTIFRDKQDYSVFLKYLSQYLVPKDLNALQKTLLDPSSSTKDKEEAVRLLRINNFSETVDLIAYCLMPNHYHLLIKQSDERSVELLMKSLMTRYSMYFNKKHDRVGTLFQSAYKAVIIETEPQLLHLSRYIHQNPPPETSKRSLPVRRLLFSQPSSYPNFLGEINQNWVKPEDILHLFSPKQTGYSSYKSFVEDLNNNSQEQSIKILKRVILDF